MTNIMALQLPDDYRASRTQIFQTKESLEWFIKKNRAELIAARALQMPTGRWLLDPPAFDRVLLEIGTRRAKRLTQTVTQTEAPPKGRD